MTTHEKELSKIDLIQKNEGFRTLIELAEDIDEKGQQLNNWKQRGISKNGAKKINAKYGYTIESLINDDAPLSKGFGGAQRAPFNEEEDSVLQAQIDAFVATLSDEACSGFMKALGQKFAKSTRRS